MKTELTKREMVALKIFIAMIKKYGFPDDDISNSRDCAKDALKMADDFLAVTKA